VIIESFIYHFSYLVHQNLYRHIKIKLLYSWVSAKMSCKRRLYIYLMILWAAYWWSERNCADILAKAAKQFVWRYLSCQKEEERKKTTSDCPFDTHRHLLQESFERLHRVCCFKGHGPKHTAETQSVYTEWRFKYVFL